uniref:Uncharacterized protein n=1 Tax=Candidatus Kentrum sp. TC TaxID=2126339 RepID=A0A450YCW1_9GAMM|nr:MAG: hypothetical protein BECKTC1821D_GA0114238_100614 [Candidatus Kentron sp. TC]
MLFRYPTLLLATPVDYPKRQTLHQPPQAITRHTRAITRTAIQFPEPLGPLRQVLARFPQLPGGLRQAPGQLYLTHIRLHLVVVQSRQMLVPLRQAPGQLPKIVILFPEAVVPLPGVAGQWLFPINHPSGLRMGLAFAVA